MFLRKNLFLVIIFVLMLPLFQLKCTGSFQNCFVYVGNGANDENEGIYIYEFDTSTGDLEFVSKQSDVIKPGYLTLSPDSKYLYCTNNNPEFQKVNSGGVSAYRVNGDGTLIFLNQQSSQGSGPCYVSTDLTGKFVMAANYNEGTIVSYPVLKDGSLGEVADVVHHQGSSANPNRQKSPHPHFIQVDPDNRCVLVNDLGVDKVYRYELDKTSGKFISTRMPCIKTDPGHGPRHLDFHPNKKYVYIMNELAGSVSVYDYPFSDSTQAAIQTISSLPDTFQGFNKSADIHVHPSGKYLYCSNRGDFDSIAIYKIDSESGQLVLSGFQKDHVHWPRNFVIDPSGDYLLVGNMSEDHIAVFRIDQETGMLSFLHKSSNVPRPSCIKFRF